MKAPSRGLKRWINLVLLVILFALGGCGLLESEDGNGGGGEGEGQDQTLVIEE